MNALDWILLALIAAAAFFALRHVWRNRKKGCGGCCGSCASCGRCPSQHSQAEPKDGAAQDRNAAETGDPGTNDGTEQ